MISNGRCHFVLFILALCILIVPASGQSQKNNLDPTLQRLAEFDDKLEWMVSDLPAMTYKFEMVEFESAIALISVNDEILLLSMLPPKLLDLFNLSFFENRLSYWQVEIGIPSWSPYEFETICLSASLKHEPNEELLQNFEKIRDEFFSLVMDIDKKLRADVGTDGNDASQANITQEEYDAIIEKFVNSCIVGDISKSWKNRQDYSVEEVRSACECVADKLTSQQPITAEEANGEFDPIVRMLEDCAETLQLEKSSNASDLPSTFPRGCRGQQRIPMTRDFWTGTIGDPFSVAWKMTLQLGSITHDFILDTTINELLINKRLADELMERGVLSEEAFGEILVPTERGQVIAERRRISRLSIGGCDFLDFEIGLIEEEGAFCGRNLLDYFSSWSFDEKNGVILLSTEPILD